MYESKWDLSRSVILVVVLTLHLVMLALLATASRAGGPATLAEHAVELLYLPPDPIPKIRSENARPRHLSGGTAITVAAPALDSSWLSAPSSSPSSGNGSGIDWPAEARRAVQAFDIRNHRAPQDEPDSGGPAEEHWWPRHHAGEQFKTAIGSCGSTKAAIEWQARAPMCPAPRSPRPFVQVARGHRADGFGPRLTQRLYRPAGT
jgi:hypothetical protein